MMVKPRVVVTVFIHSYRSRGHSCDFVILLENIHSEVKGTVQEGKWQLLSFTMSVHHKSKHEKNNPGWASIGFCWNSGSCVSMGNAPDT